MSTTSTEEGKRPLLGGKTKQLRRAIALACICAWVILPARPVSAHAIVLSTQPSADEIVPRAPDGVVMRFNEPVEVSFGAIRVFDSDGNRVDDGDAEHLEGRADEVEVPLETDLPAGTYTVTWRVVSTDAHPISEAFVFHVEAPGARPQGIADEILATDSGSGRLPGIIYGVARWVNFAALLILAGGAIFLAVVWRRRSGIQRQAIVEHAFLRRWKSIVLVSWVAALLATLASFVLQGAVAGDLPLSDALSSSVLRAVAETRFGKVMLAKLLLLGALAAFLLAFRRHLFRPETGESVGAAGSSQRLPISGVAMGGVLVAVLLATPGLAGHAGTTDPVVLNVSADTLHLGAGAAWLGGLVLLLAAAFPATKTLSDHDSAATLAPVVGRFSDMAMIAVSVIVVTGVYRAWLEVGALRALTGETYGWVLLIKVAAFLPIVAMGAVNNRWAKPRIQRAASENSSARGPLRVLRRVIGAEIALAVVVLAVTALLVNLPPARVAASGSGPFVKDVHTADHMFNVLVDPNEVGENEVHVTVASHAGAPAPIKELRVLFRMPAEDIGPLVGRGRRLQKGHFVVQGHQLSVSGIWQLEIVARVSNFEETRTTVSVPVNE